MLASDWSVSAILTHDWLLPPDGDHTEVGGQAMTRRHQIPGGRACHPDPDPDPHIGILCQGEIIATFSFLSAAITDLCGPNDGVTIKPGRKGQGVYFIAIKAIVQGILGTIVI